MERVALRVPSEVDCIEEAVAVLTRHCLSGADASPRVQFRLQVALSDALANAIVRGNREDAEKQVYVQVDLHPDAVNIHVTDEGDGFDHASVAEALDPAVARPSERPRTVPHPAHGGRRPLQHPRQLHLHDAAPPVRRLDEVLEGLSRLSGLRVRLWRNDGQCLRFLAGPAASWTLDVPASAGACATPEGTAWLAPARWVPDDWVELSGADPTALAAKAASTPAGALRAARE